VLLFEEHIETQPNFIGGRIYIRLAAQVYNEASDFEKLRVAVEKRANG
jgi:hypothetical protein